MMRAGIDYDIKAGVEVVRPYEFRQVGQVFYPPAMLAERLIKLGFVKARVAAPTASPPAATSGASPARQTDLGLSAAGHPQRSNRRR